MKFYLPDGTFNSPGKAGKWARPRQSMRGSIMKRNSKLTIAIGTTVLTVLGGTVAYAEDKYSLKSPSGIAFSDFKGYEDWAVVSSARTDEVLKVIVANPTMIKA